MEVRGEKVRHGEQRANETYLSFTRDYEDGDWEHMSWREGKKPIMSIILSWPWALFGIIKCSVFVFLMKQQKLGFCFEPIARQWAMTIHLWCCGTSYLDSPSFCFVSETPSAVLHQMQTHQEKSLDYCSVKVMCYHHCDVLKMEESCWGFLSVYSWGYKTLQSKVFCSKSIFPINPVVMNWNSTMQQYY